MNKKGFLVIPLTLLIIGVLTGFSRLLSIYHSRDSPIYPISEAMDRYLSKLYGIHSHIIVLGFIALLILFERFSGYSKGYSKHILLSGLIFGSLGIFLLILSVTILKSLYYLSLGLILIPALSFLGYISINRRYINLNTSILWISSYIIYILAVSIDLFSISVPINIYPLYILLYPILFILGERLELTRFIPIGREAYIIIPTLTGLIVINMIFILFGGRYILLGIFNDFILILLTLYLIYIDPTVWGKGRDVKSIYLSTHLRIGYIMLLAGILTNLSSFYIIGFNLYDLSTHLLALGFVGSMLIGHGPIVISQLLGFKPRFSYIPVSILLTSILLRGLVDIGYSLIGPVQSNILMGISGILTILTIPLFLSNLNRES